MIASLGMYDLPPLQAANDRLWYGIRDRLRASGMKAPDALTRGSNAYWVAWQSRDLVLSQTCGYPYRALLHGRVTLVGTPDYGIDGCEPGYYRSVFVARAYDTRQALAEYSGCRFAYNEALSQSGWAAPQTHAAAHGLVLPPALRTGSHPMSAQAVADGRADLAAIDAVTWRLMLEHEAFTDLLKVVGQTDPSPGLPCISRPDVDSGLLFDALSGAIAELSDDDRKTLHLRGAVQIPASAYLALPIPRAPEALTVALR